MNKQEHNALQLCVDALDQLLPYLAKVPADVGLLNSALMAARPLLKQEPAPAQDEREAPIVVATAILGGLFHGGSGPELGEIDIEVCTPALETIQCETVNSSDDVFLPLMTVAQHERIVAALTRPAQTAPQPEQSGLDPHAIAQQVREALDRQACPNSWMVIAYEAAVAALSQRAEP